MVGQDLATRQLVDAICTHLSQPHPLRPLIISVHGPPGVGKTYTHTLLARALYNTDPQSATQCPGQDCRGAKVIYGLDFTGKRRSHLNRGVLPSNNSPNNEFVMDFQFNTLCISWSLYLTTSVDSREEQLNFMRSAILDHARAASDPLIVIEEYDKLDCPARGMLRQIMQSPDIANASLNR